MSNEPDPYDMLFRAKWNVPQAAEALGKSWEGTKELFSEWCKTRPTTYTLQKAQKPV